MIVSRMKLATLGLVLIVSILANPGDRIPNHPNCSDNEGPIPVYFVHPTNCSRFYECKQKDAWEFECPAGLHFNNKINVCDYPVNAQCELQSTNSPSSTTYNPTTTTGWTTVTETTVDLSTSNTSSTIEYTTTTAHPTPEDTTENSYTTTQGTTTSSYPTPEGTPEETTETSHPPPESTTTSSYPAPEDTTTTSHQTTDGTTTTPFYPTPEISTAYPPTTPQPNCPPSGATQPNYWADDSDCTRYLGCLENCIQEFKCPSGLYWNDQQKLCDSFANSRCCPVIPPAPNVWPSTSTTSIAFIQSKEPSTQHLTNCVKCYFYD